MPPLNQLGRKSKKESSFISEPWSGNIADLPSRINCQRTFFPFRLIPVIQLSYWMTVTWSTRFKQKHPISSWREENEHYIPLRSFWEKQRIEKFDIFRWEGGGVEVLRREGYGWLICIYLSEKKRGFNLKGRDEDRGGGGGGVKLGSFGVWRFIGLDWIGERKVRK